MAARLMLAAALLAAGCFHPATYSPDHTVAKWRSIHPVPETGGTEAAAPAIDQPGALTAAQAYALAIDNNPDVAVLAAEAEVGNAEVDAAKQLDNPQLRVTSFDVDDVVARRSWVNIGVRVPIPRPGTIRAARDGAKLAAASQASLTDDGKRLLRVAIYKAYARLAMLTLDLEHATRTAELERSRRAHLDTRLEQAVATQLEVALADLDHAEAVSEEEKLRDEIVDVERELTRLVGADRPLRFHVDREGLQKVVIDLDRERLTEQAMAARPELHAAQYSIGHAKSEEYLARSQSWPWLDWVQAQYLAGPDSNRYSWGFGLALSLPVLSWNRGEIKAARATVRQREAEERAKIVRVADEVDTFVVLVERTGRRALQLER
ncbi:MAG: TolC family protein, partial [Deltaproteobacteria bacterium]|nr:TolC family protein [Nannocystaceae bacterium]